MQLPLPALPLLPQNRIYHVFPFAQFICNRPPPVGVCVCICVSVGYEIINPGSRRRGAERSAGDRGKQDHSLGCCALFLFPRYFNTCSRLLAGKPTTIRTRTQSPEFRISVVPVPTPRSYPDFPELNSERRSFQPSFVRYSLCMSVWLCVSVCVRLCHRTTLAALIQIPLQLLPAVAVSAFDFHP